jgi:anti-sigma-K factor RskA
MKHGKSRMPIERSDEALLVSYLLGNLSEQEQVRVEDRAFADPVYLGALEATEADLIDEYVLGGLSASDRRKFEGRFLTSPQRRSKVEFARALAQVTTEFNPGRPVVPERLPFRQALLSFVRGFHPAVQLAAVAAALVVVAGAAFLTIQNSAMRSRMTLLEAQRVELVNRAQSLQQQISQQQARPLETQKPPVAIERLPLLASLVFPPGVSRAETRVHQLTLPPGAQLAHLLVQLEPRDKFPRFRAELRTRGGEEVLVRNGLTGQLVGGTYSVSFDIPASALPAGEYELGLKGLSGGPDTEIGFYYFRVKKQ